MLGLKLATDVRWSELVAADLPAAMADHAYCEQKAASNAISLIVLFPARLELVTSMAQLAQEEMQHFARVHALLLQRGWPLGRERKDAYVNELQRFMRKGQGNEVLLLDRLLVAAMVEARSCERFKLLATTLKDAELAAFYYELMMSEANHYTTFIRLAKLYILPQTVEKRWQELLAYEAALLANYGTSSLIHG